MELPLHGLAVSMIRALALSRRVRDDEQRGVAASGPESPSVLFALALMRALTASIELRAQRPGRPRVEPEPRELAAADVPDLPDPLSGRGSA